MKSLSTMNRRQKGMTLTETLLALGVTAMVAVLAYGGYKMATGDVSTSSMTNGVTQSVSKVKQIWGPMGSYTGVSNDNLNKSGGVPKDFKVSGTTILNSWGGNVVFSPGATASEFLVGIQGIPTAECAKFLSSVEGLAYTLRTGVTNDSTGTITGTPYVVKDSTTALSTTTLMNASSCGSAAATVDAIVTIR